ncbi:MAG: hypothetical protein AAF423_07720 [Pseudomonadota bacterium]
MPGKKSAIVAALPFLIMSFVCGSAISQEFDWNEDFTNGRKVKNSPSTSGTNLPGVRSNLFDGSSRKQPCIEATLGELVTGSQQQAGDCVNKPLTVFQLPTERR